MVVDIGGGVGIVMCVGMELALSVCVLDAIK